MTQHIQQESQSNKKNTLLKLEMLYSAKRGIQESSTPLDSIQYLVEEVSSQAEDILEAYVTTRVKEAERLARIDELKTVFHKHGRTYRQTVVDNTGAVYIEDSHRYISSYEVQERILALTTTTNGKEARE